MNEAELVPNARSGIYAITYVASGKQYIGSSVNIRNRWKKHWKDLADHKHHSPHLQHAWDKYGPDAFTFTVLEEVSDVTRLIEREQAYIDARLAARGSREYNVAPRAGSVLGLRLSEESRRKRSQRRRLFPTPAEIADGERRKGKYPAYMRAALLKAQQTPRTPESIRCHAEAMRKAWQEAREQGKSWFASEKRKAANERLNALPKSPEHRAKIAATLRGHKQSPEQIAKRMRTNVERGVYQRKSWGYRGRKHSAETRAKMSESHRGQSQPFRRTQARLAYFQSIKGVLTPGIKAAADACRGKPWSDARRAAYLRRKEHVQTEPISQPKLFD